jgi:hypothetical protein
MRSIHTFGREKRLAAFRSHALCHSIPFSARDRCEPDSSSRRELPGRREGRTKNACLVGCVFSRMGLHPSGHLRCWRWPHSFARSAPHHSYRSLIVKHSALPLPWNCFAKDTTRHCYQGCGRVSSTSDFDDGLKVST